MTAIVVTAFDRPDALRRVLASLERCRAPLVISIDGDGAPLRSVEMPRGARVIVQGERLGLKEHFFRAADLAEEHGAIIVLEDDLWASPALLEYVDAALAAYAGEPDVAGLSLYSFCFNECGETPFAAIDDGHDAYFAQLAGWGLAFTREQWGRIRSWLAARGGSASTSPLLPRAMNRWPEPTWKRLLNLYLAEERKYLVVPRRGVVTNLAEPGVHVSRAVTYLSAPVVWGSVAWRLPSFAESRCRYDSFLQLEPDSLRAWSRVPLPESLAVDLYSQRDAVDAEWIITAGRWRAAERTFGLRLFPFEMNVIEGIAGERLALARREDTISDGDDTLRRMRTFFIPPWR